MAKAAAGSAGCECQGMVHLLAVGTDFHDSQSFDSMVLHMPISNDDG